MINKSLEEWLNYNESKINIGYDSDELVQIIFDTQQCIDRCELLHGIDQNIVNLVLGEVRDVLEIENL